MSYIKIKIPLIETDASGSTTHARIKRLESDMPAVSTEALQLILHALSAPGMREDGPAPLLLGVGRLASPMWYLGGSSPLTLGVSALGDAEFVLGQH